LLPQEERFDKHKTTEHSIIQADCALSSWSSQNQKNNKSRFNGSFNKGNHNLSRNNASN